MNSDHLMREVELYLRAVALFRRLGCEPTWRAECQCIGAERDGGTAGATERRVGNGPVV